MEEVVQMRVGEAIAAVRNRAGLTLRDLADRTGIQHSHLSELETGVRPNPNWRNIVKIARALNVSLDELAECE